MRRDETARVFGCDTREAAAAVRRLVAEGVLTGPRGQYVNFYSPDNQRQRARDLRARACDLRREAIVLNESAREIEQRGVRAAALRTPRHWTAASGRPAALPRPADLKTAARRVAGAIHRHADRPMVMSCRARTRHTYDGTRREGRMT